MSELIKYANFVAMVMFLMMLSLVLIFPYQFPRWMGILMLINLIFQTGKNAFSKQP